MRSHLEPLLPLLAVEPEHLTGQVELLVAAQQRLGEDGHQVLLRVRDLVVHREVGELVLQRLVVVGVHADVDGGVGDDLLRPGAFPGAVVAHIRQALAAGRALLQRLGSLGVGAGGAAGTGGKT